MQSNDFLETNNRVIGILGGMGPEATLDLYRHIIELTPASRDQDHIKVLMYSNPKIPDRTEAIVAGGVSPLPYLIEAAHLLEKAGAGIIAMPCNSAHHYFKEIQLGTGIPILNMIEETRLVLSERLPEIQTVGLLAIAGTLKSGVYQRALGRSGLRVLCLDSGEEERVQTAIVQVKAEGGNPWTKKVFESAARRLVDMGAKAVILGCTEIPLYFDPDCISRPCLNTTRILAQASVDWALGKKNIAD
jgi:aspartate racemase